MHPRTHARTHRSSDAAAAGGGGGGGGGGGQTRWVSTLLQSCGFIGDNDCVKVNVGEGGVSDVIDLVQYLGDVPVLLFNGVVQHQH